MRKFMSWVDRVFAQVHLPSFIAGLIIPTVAFSLAEVLLMLKRLN
jgi:hypothetical protein